MLQKRLTLHSISLRRLCRKIPIEATSGLVSLERVVGFNPLPFFEGPPSAVIVEHYHNPELIRGAWYNFESTKFQNWPINSALTVGRVEKSVFVRIGLPARCALLHSIQLRGFPLSFVPCCKELPTCIGSVSKSSVQDMLIALSTFFD